MTQTCCLASTNTPVTAPMIQWLGISSGHDGSTLNVGTAWAAGRAAWPTARVSNTVSGAAHSSAAVRTCLARMVRIWGDSISRLGSRRPYGLTL